MLKTVTVDDESQDTEQQETAENMTETEISTTVHGVFKNSNNISNDTKETRNNTDASFKDRCSLKACSNHSRSMANEIATNGMPTLGDIEVENFKREHECDINNIKSNAENKKNCPRKIFAVRNSDEHTKEQRSIRKFVPILFKIVKSPVVVFLNISVALIFMFQTAIGLFLPKIIQNQFNQSTATAGLLAGIYKLAKRS